MELTVNQHDALTELINIGYGRAASALSELTGYRVALEVPRIVMLRIDEVATQLSDLVKGDVASVNQVFSGPIAGNAVLMLDERAACALSRLLSEETPVADSFDTSDREIITEVGNILLNACLGVFGNLLQVQVSFSVPRLNVAGIGGILKTITVESHELHYGLMIHTQFRLRSSDVSGYLVIVLGITSLDRLLRELDQWEARQIK